MKLLSYSRPPVLCSFPAACSPGNSGLAWDLLLIFDLVLDLVVELDLDHFDLGHFELDLGHFGELLVAGRAAALVLLLPDGLRHCCRCVGRPC